MASLVMMERQTTRKIMKEKEEREHRQQKFLRINGQVVEEDGIVEIIVMVMELQLSLCITTL